MQQATPQTIAHQLDADLASVEDRISHFLSPDDGAIAALLASADQLAKADALEASHLKGRIHALTGDRRQVDYWFANARRLRDDWRADFNHASCLASLGHFADAAAMATRIPSIDLEMMPMLISLSITVLDLDRARAVSMALQRVNAMPEAICDNDAKTALDVLAYYRVPLERARAVLEVAGELIREQRLWWLGRQPRLFAHLDSNDAGVLYELQVATSTAHSCTLNDQFIDRLIDRNLLLPGFSFAFLGVGDRSPAIASQRLKRVH